MLRLAGFRSLKLESGAADSVTLDVGAPDGTAIVWYWHSADKDVLYRAVFTPIVDYGGGADIILHAESREKGHKGTFVPPSAGRFTLYFSNAHSRFTSKLVYVRLSAGHSQGECRIRSLRPFTDRKTYLTGEASSE